MKGRIVIVEDDDLIAHLIKIILKKKDYMVTAIATTGEEAIARAVETVPDLVLMDIRLKGRFDGIDAATHISTLLNIPVVFITAAGDEATLERAKQTHPYGFIKKPFNEREIEAAIENALYQHAAKRPGGVRRKRDEAFSAVALTDPEGQIVYLNKQGKELLGIDLERSFSLPFDDAVTLWDPVTATEVRDLIGSATKGNLIQKELSLRRQKKEEMFVLVEAGRLMTMDGTVQGGICILQPL